MQVGNQSEIDITAVCLFWFGVEHVEMLQRYTGHLHVTTCVMCYPF